MIDSSMDGHVWHPDSSPELPTTPEWCAEARHKYRELGYTQHTLAKQLGCAQSALSATLNGTYKTSRLVLPLCEQLGLEPPIAILDDPDVAAFYRLAMELRKKSPREAANYFRSQAAAIAALLGKK